ncbi:hypothetical protein [Bradyrhizobium sp. BR 1433]|uniref:hypothetical protein n=1 Tax=Bradyrhizobium sp. BR 1433 TaxID=3447967 RepID=UPI003EE5CB40
MQLNSFSLPASVDPAQFGLVPGTSSALRPSDQIGEGKPSIFEAMLSVSSGQEKSDVPSTSTDPLQPELPVPQDPLDQLPADVKAAIEALEKTRFLLPQPTPLPSTNRPRLRLLPHLRSRPLR